MTAIAKLPARAKRTQRIGQEPDARTPMLLELAQRMQRMAILERLASSPAYLKLANVAHAVNSYTSTASINDSYEPSLAFYLYQNNLNRWTDAKYVGTMDAIQNALPMMPERKDTERLESLNRSHTWTWSFETGDSEHPVATLKIHLDAYECAETAECRKIQVGTKLVETPIYKYDCVAPEGNAGALPAPVLELENLI